MDFIHKIMDKNEEGFLIFVAPKINMSIINKS